MQNFNVLQPTSNVTFNLVQPLNSISILKGYGFINIEETNSISIYVNNDTTQSDYLSLLLYSYPNFPYIQQSYGPYNQICRLDNNTNFSFEFRINPYGNIICSGEFVTNNQYFKSVISNNTNNNLRYNSITIATNSDINLFASNSNFILQ